MATLVKEFAVDAPPEAVWDVVRDVGALHTRLAPGVVVDTRLEPGLRVVRFANGLVLRELIVSVDDARRRLVYSSVGGQATHHNASVQVLPEGAGRSRFVWTTDLLPDTLVAAVDPLQDQVAAVMKQTLDRLGKG
ncbi:MAG TPA: SRPBCC family protein [Albitalea sp.]|uniref:SRPBCC family protein n=1 Tax=Piscinibacter sp. TaxID=1903157 RepID=UPI002ED6AFA9